VKLHKHEYISWFVMWVKQFSTDSGHEFLFVSFFNDFCRSYHLWMQSFWIYVVQVCVYHSVSDSSLSYAVSRVILWIRFFQSAEAYAIDRCLQLSGFSLQSFDFVCRGWFILVSQRPSPRHACLASERDFVRKPAYYRINCNMTCYRFFPLEQPCSCSI